MEIFEDTIWQMSIGERAAFEGVLSQVKPELSIEIGTAEGASLKRIAAHSREVHSFDLVAPSLDLPDHVTLHGGDSHVLLPEFLEKLAEEGRNVDFVLVDGDHSAEGVKADLEDLLDSPALQRTVILIHDINNEEVRRGVDDVRYRSWRKVVYADLDLVAGYMFKDPSLRYELWGGLGMVLVDASRPSTRSNEVLQQRYYPAAPLYAEIRDITVAREEGRSLAGSAQLEEQNGRIEQLEQELQRRTQELAEAQEAAAQARHWHSELERSFSWKITRPLRAAKARVRRALS